MPARPSPQPSLPREFRETLANQPRNVGWKTRAALVMPGRASPQPILPPELLEVPANQPPNVDRKTGAALVTRHMYPVSHRSLEGWTLPTRRVNGRALIPTATLFEAVYAKFADAPVVMGGRNSATTKAP